MRHPWQIGDFGKHRLTLFPPFLLLALDPFRLFASALGLFAAALLLLTATLQRSLSFAFSARCSLRRSSALSSRASFSRCLIVASIIAFITAREMPCFSATSVTLEVEQPLD